MTPSRVQQQEGNEEIAVLRAASRMLCSGDTLEAALQLCSFAHLLFCSWPENRAVENASLTIP